MNLARRRWFVIAALVGLAAIAGGFYWYGGRPAAAVVIDATDAAAVAEGKQVYVEHCAACHGADLEGEPNWRRRKPDGRLPAPPHDASGHTWHHPDQHLFEMTKRGTAAFVGRGYESDMPAYDGILSDDEIVAVLAYIKSRWPAEIRARHDMMNRQMRQ